MVYGILEDATQWHHREIDGVPILGTTHDQTFLALLQEECAFSLAYEDYRKRKKCLNHLTEAVKPQSISAIHPSALIVDPTQLGQGNYIGAQVCLASDVKIGHYTILHNGVIIEPETTVHDWVTIGAGSIIADHVTIEEQVTIGMGVRVLSGVTLQKGAFISSGTVVTTNVNSEMRL